MNEKLLNILSKRPDLYAPSTSKFWDDDHISKGMLEAHLNPDMDSATRNLDFVKNSAKWITEISDPDIRPKLLDLGCGPGIYAELLTAEGFQVTGIDLSLRSIQYAMDNALKNGSHINFLCKNYLTIDYDQEFDVITMIYCDFGVLDYEDRKILLDKIHRALKPGGLLIFDVCTPKQYEHNAEVSTWSYSNGGYWSTEPYACLYSFYRYDTCNTYAEQYVIIDNSDIKCYNIWNHGFTINELESDLAVTGFHKADYWDDISGKDFTGHNEAICVVAYK